MTCEIAYDKKASLQLNIPADRLVAMCANGDGATLNDPAEATVAAVSHPIGYPDLHRAVVPGDQVLIALAEGLPRSAAAVAGIVDVLRSADVGADAIRLLHANRAEQERFDQLAGETPGLPDLAATVHDPESETDLAYLAATKGGHPIYLNRALCDADLVIPVNLMRVDSSFDYDGVHGGLFPTFADTATQRRHRAVATAHRSTSRRQWESEIDEVAWLLGIQLTVQLIPGPGDSVLHVLAGLGEELWQEGQHLCAQAWLTEVPRRASLVVATIEGASHEQTWRNFGRALFAASQVCDEQGSIVLCTGMRQRGGPALQRLARHGPSSQVLREIQRDRSVDAIPASLLIQTCERQHVYLLSGLDEALVESMQVGYVRSPAEIDRLIRRHESCIILANAHRAVATARP